MFEKLIKKLKPKKAAPQKRPVTNRVTKSEKDIASSKGEPYVSIVSMDVDPENLHQGSFELDWNDKFVANLMRAGYQGESDEDIVDQWFQNVCRHVVMETYDQYDAMNRESYVKTRDLGDGRKEIS